MTTDELIEFLGRRHWTEADRDVLIDEWNSRRDDVGKIGHISVRTPCRLRQVVGSFRIFLSRQKTVN